MIELNRIDQLFLAQGSIGMGLVVFLVFTLWIAGSRTTSIDSNPSVQSITPISQEYECFHRYSAQMPDEISVNVGDRIIILSMFDDQWINGFNIDSNEQGILPLTCLSKSLNI